MKKAISIFLAVVMVLALVACGNSAAPNAPAATNNGSETAGTDSDTIKIGYVSDLTGATSAMCSRRRRTTPSSAI